MSDQQEVGNTADEEPTPVVGVIADARFGYHPRGGGFGLYLTFRQGQQPLGNFYYATQPAEAELAEGVSESDRDNVFAGAVRMLNSILNQAGRYSTEQLPGTPVELQVLGREIVGWRVLQEAL